MKIRIRHSETLVGGEGQNCRQFVKKQTRRANRRAGKKYGEDAPKKIIRGWTD